MTLTNRQIGGLKAAHENKQRDPNFYSVIGAIGGRKSRGGGFGTNTDPSYAGRKSAAMKKWLKAGKLKRDFPKEEIIWQELLK